MQDKDLKAQQEARDAVEAAYSAFEVLARFSQGKIDEICDAMSRAALAESERLGRMASEETGFGRPEDKLVKNRFAAETVWQYFKGLKTVGVVNDTGSVVEIASPRGVVAAIIPSTNPTSTAIFKIIISIKSRNAIVLSPHPSAAKCIAETTRIMRDAAIAKGLPADAIACLSISSIEGTETLMKHRKTAVILATGGTGLVRAAYSSGKPAFGVGPGNVPVFVERSADLAKAAADILTGTCFDNGTICASEQSVVADAPIADRLREEFKTTLPRFDLMAQLDKTAVGMTVGEVSQRLMVSNGNVTAVVAGLVTDGLVDKRPAPQDRRVQILTLTAQGRKAFRAMAERHESWIAELLANHAKPQGRVGSVPVPRIFTVD